MTERAEEQVTMVNALREEPGSYTRILENGSEVVYTIRPLNGGFVAGWEYATGTSPVTSQQEEFSSHADALKYLEENFDAPLGGEREGS